MSPDELLRQVRALDERVLSVARKPVGAQDSMADEAGYGHVLLAGMSAAALSASMAISSMDFAELLDTRKTTIDGAATRAAEAVFDRASVAINVAAGEGSRDDSPGASTGQRLGHGGAHGAAAGEEIDAVFDYVDGTTLAASNAPGALALGSFGRGILAVPDLQAYVVIAPRPVLGLLDIMPPPEEHVPGILRCIADHASKDISDLTVFTHSLSSNLMHTSLIDLFRSQVAATLVPDSVTIEPPYLLSLAGLTHPRIDTMIGAIGLSELAFAATLLDLSSPDYGFAFRIGSIAGPRQAAHEKTLAPLFNFSDKEREMIHASGLSPDRQYFSHDMVKPGSSLTAAIFAVTENEALGLRAPAISASEASTRGLLLEQGRKISRISVSYELGPRSLAGLRRCVDRRAPRGPLTHRPYPAALPGNSR